MSDEPIKVEQFDEWLTDDSEVAALVMRQWLEPVEGRDAVIFPPTYAKPPGVRDEDWLGYNIDRFDDGTSVCQIDSVGSQANRMEPLFKREKYRHLVPEVVIEAGGRKIYLLDAGHRAADAIVRFSKLGPRLHDAFCAYQDRGDAEPLARIAPTSIVFGSWDSRATQAKLPRIVRSVIRAYNVMELHRSAQYTTIAGDILADGEAPVATTETRESRVGLAHVPAVRTHGGVQVLGEIRRDGVLNLAAVRTLAGSPGGDKNTLRLRRYVFGLGLVSFTSPPELSLREGCQLVLVPDRAADWELVKHDGHREKSSISHKEALDFATAAASDFGVENSTVMVSFDLALANEVLKLGDAERKKLFRQGPVTIDAVNRLKHRGATTDTPRETE